MELDKQKYNDIFVPRKWVPNRQISVNFENVFSRSIHRQNEYFININAHKSRKTEENLLSAVLDKIVCQGSVLRDQGSVLR